MIKNPWTETESMPESIWNIGFLGVHLWFYAYGYNFFYERKLAAIWVYSYEYIFFGVGFTLMFTASIVMDI